MLSKLIDRESPSLGFWSCWLRYSRHSLQLTGSWQRWAVRTVPIPRPAQEHAQREETAARRPIGVSGTPTVILADRAAIVQKIWCGRLSEGSEKQLLTALNIDP